MISNRPFRKKRNFVIALLTELLAPLLRSLAECRARSSVAAPRLWRRALILGDNHIGDLLYRTASLAALKSGLPECDFYYLAAPDTADILTDNPNLKAVLPWARSDSRLDISAEHKSALRDFRFDAALCTNCIRYWPELLLALSLGIPHRVGYTYKGFSGLVTHPVPIRYPQPYAVYFRDYVAALTGRTENSPLRPVVYLSAAAECEAERAWQQLGLSGKMPVIAFFLTSRHNTELWPVHAFRELFNRAATHFQTRCLLVGTAGDRDFLISIAGQGADRPQICAGELSLPGLSALVRRCALIVTKDSGPRHIANAVGTPALFFRNTAVSQAESGVYCATELDLVPDGEFLTKAKQSALLAQITPDMVFQRIEQALSMPQGGRTPPETMKVINQ